MPAIYMLWRGSYDQGDNDRRLSWSSFDGRGASPQWSPRIVLGDRASYSGPALTVFQDQLYAAWRGDGGAADDQTLYWATLVLRNGKAEWSPQHPLDGRASFSGPALAAFRNKLYMAWRGIETDHNIYWATYDGQQWSPQCELGDRGSLSSPSLAVFRDKLYMAWRGANEDRTLWWSTFDGNSPTLPCAQQWSPQHQLGDRASERGPVLVVFQDKLFMFWRGTESDTLTDQHLYFATLDASGNWSGQNRLDPLFSFRTPALAAFRNELYIAYIGTSDELGGSEKENETGTEIDPFLRYTTFDGANPKLPPIYVDIHNATSVAGPAMAVFPEVTNSLKLFLSRHGFDASKGTRQAGTGSIRDLMAL